mgnify:CR=1 FL=1
MRSYWLRRAAVEMTASLRRKPTRPSSQPRKSSGRPQVPALIDAVALTCEKATSWTLSKPDTPCTAVTQASQATARFDAISHRPPWPAGAAAVAGDGPPGGYLLQLSDKRFVTLSDYRGKWYVNVREYYSKDGELAPSSKGLSMGVEQWRTLVDNIEVRWALGKCIFLAGDWHSY